MSDSEELSTLSLLLILYRLWVELLFFMFEDASRLPLSVLSIVGCGRLSRTGSYSSLLIKFLCICYLISFSSPATSRRKMSMTPTLGNLSLIYLC